MNVLGISGFDNAAAQKRAHWPGLPEREYQMCQGQDSAAALVVEGNIVAAAAEERFTGQKHTGSFPIHAIRYCLEAGGLRLQDVDVIAHGFDYSPVNSAFADAATEQLYAEVFSREAVLRTVRTHLGDLPSERFTTVNHHLAHAASVFYTSGWQDGLVVVSDGMGETHSTSVYEARDGQLHRVGGIAASNSIGILYSIVTHHLGFDFNADEYKIMGLAPYGDAARFAAFFAREVQLNENGGINIPMLRLNKSRSEREYYTATREHLTRHLVPPRAPSHEVTQEHCDVAAALQMCLNRVVLHVCGSYQRRTAAKRLMLAGGVALNCSANGKLYESGLFQEIYLSPASGDDGTALGAALLEGVRRGAACKNVRLPSAFLGPQYSPKEVRSALASFADRVHYEDLSDLETTTRAAARLICEGKVLAWYRGRMEFGPRALGNRSILGDPRDPHMRERINAMIKKREAFRPFAPAASLRDAARCFEIPAGREFPFMNSVVPVRREYREQLPAVTHVDGTARLQTVTALSNPDFAGLLTQVGRLSGMEVVLNTSFNVKGQPMVNTPCEALETYLTAGIDALFLENYCVTRK